MPAAAQTTDGQGLSADARTPKRSGLAPAGVPARHFQAEKIDRSEIAHVLSIGLAEMPSDEPADAIRTLQRIAYQQPLFQNALAAREVARLNAPDGIVLSFFTTAVAAVRAAFP